MTSKGLFGDNIEVHNGDFIRAVEALGKAQEVRLRVTPATQAGFETATQQQQHFKPAAAAAPPTAHNQTLDAASESSAQAQADAKLTKTEFMLALKGIMPKDGKLPKAEEVFKDEYDLPRDDWERRWHPVFAYTVQHRFTLFALSVGTALFMLTALTIGYALLRFVMPEGIAFAFEDAVSSRLVRLADHMYERPKLLALGFAVLSGIGTWIGVRLRKLYRDLPEGAERKHAAWVLVGIALLELVLIARGSSGWLLILLLLAGGPAKLAWKLVVTLRRHVDLNAGKQG